MVYGVQWLAQIMKQGTVTVTASLADITPMESDPVYAMTKHAVPGFVTSVVSQLSPIQVNTVCPGFTDNRLLSVGRGAAAIAAHDVPLLTPREVAAAIWEAATSRRTGETWFVQPGRSPEPFRFPRVPGPRAR